MPKHMVPPVFRGFLLFCFFNFSSRFLLGLPGYTQSDPNGMTKRLSLQLPTLQEKNGAQNIFPDQELNHRPLELDTTALPFYYSLDLLHMPPNQAIPHI